MIYAFNSSYCVERSKLGYNSVQQHHHHVNGILHLAFESCVEEINDSAMDEG